MEQTKDKEVTKITNINSKFKKFGGERIPDIIQYIKDYVAEYPKVTISLGCDSVQRRKKTVYAFTLMFYSVSIKNGAHVVYFRENISKIRDNFDRLAKEAEFIHRHISDNERNLYSEFSEMRRKFDEYTDNLRRELQAYTDSRIDKALGTTKKQILKD